MGTTVNGPFSGTWLGQVSVQVSAAPAQETPAWLDPDERQRMRSFRNRAAAEAWARSRVLLRQRLAAELGIHPSTLRYRRLPCTACGSARHGKPVIDEPAASNLDFSLSRSAGLVGIALARGVQIGIDIEGRRSLDLDALMESAFSGDERKAVLAVSGAQRRASLILRSITRKEAIVKALGAHLGLHPRSVPSHPHTPGSYTALVPRRGSLISVRVESREIDEGIHCSVAAIEGQLKTASSAA